MAVAWIVSSGGHLCCFLHFFFLFFPLREQYLAAVMDYVKPDLVCATESWLSVGQTRQARKHQRYEVRRSISTRHASYRNDRGTLSGGVFILVNENLVSSEMPEASGPDEGEVIWIKVQTQGNKQLYIGSYCIPHRQKAHLDCLDRSLQKITVKKDRHIILCGDFNCHDIDWDTHTIPPGANDRQVQLQLIDLAEKYNLHQMQDLPTRENNILDLVFTTNPTLFKSPQMHQVYQTNISSSLTFVYDLFGHVKPQENTTRSARLTAKTLRQAAAETELFKAGKDVHNLWKTLKSQLFDAIDKHIPSALRSGKHQLPWMNGKLRRLIEKKRRL